MYKLLVNPRGKIFFIHNTKESKKGNIHYVDYVASLVVLTEDRYVRTKQTEVNKTEQQLKM